MATAARFTAGGSSSSPPTPAPATTPPVQPQTTQLIVLPASLHQAAAAGTLVNGVPVIDVSALEQAAESSNESTATGEHQGEAHETDPIGQSSPHFITVTVAEGDAVASHQGYHIQYVEPEIYATQTGGGGQAQMAYPVYTVGESGTLYTAGQSQYYAATNAGTTNATGTVGYTTTGGHYVVQQTVDTDGLITSRNSPQTTNGETTFVATATVHSSQSSNQVSPDDIGSGIGHATRVSPATVQWLLENYETAEGVSLPRSTLYSHYLRHCGENKLEPVNAASFGKLIRSVFLGLRTRRLGTRGNSKYHYYGIRVKPGSSLVNVDDSGNRLTTVASTSSGKTQQGGSIRSFKRENSEPNVSVMLSTHVAYLGDGSNAIPTFPDIIFNEHLPDDCGFDDVDTLKSIYREHLEAFLDAILSLEFTTVESLWREFWRSQYNNNGDECEEEKYLSKSKLFSLCNLEPVQNFMKQVDLMFYQNLIQVLVPDVLKPIPATLTQSIRNFAKNLENWLTHAMSGAPTQMLHVKLSAVSAFSSSLRRYTSLNHLAQAARAVLHNTTQISQMLADLNRVDFNSVREQASWVCQCENDILGRFESDFKLTLQQQNSLEQWASWLKAVVKKALKPYEGKPSFSKAARQFLLKWSFYSSMVIRDLTLRSAASFGSFHLIRLLYDEYMFYLIEHQVAEATGCVPIAVILEGIKQDIMQNNLNSMYQEDSYCNGMVSSKLGRLSPSENNKRAKIS